MKVKLRKKKQKLMILRLKLKKQLKRQLLINNIILLMNMKQYKLAN